MTPWPKRKDLKQAGALYAMSAGAMYQSYMMSLLTRVMDWTSEDADALLKGATAAHHERKSGVHAYNKL